MPRHNFSSVPINRRYAVIRAHLDSLKHEPEKHGWSVNEVFEWLGMIDAMYESRDVGTCPVGFDGTWDKFGFNQGFV